MLWASMGRWAASALDRQGFPERGAVPGVSVVRTPYLIEVLCDWFMPPSCVRVAGPCSGSWRLHGSGGSCGSDIPGRSGLEACFRPSSTHEPWAGDEAVRRVWILRAPPRPATPPGTGKPPGRQHDRHYGREAPFIGGSSRHMVHGKVSPVGPTLAVGGTRTVLIQHNSGSPPPARRKGWRPVNVNSRLSLSMNSGIGSGPPARTCIHPFQSRS